MGIIRTAELPLNTSQIPNCQFTAIPLSFFLEKKKAAYLKENYFVSQREQPRRGWIPITPDKRSAIWGREQNFGKRHLGEVRHRLVASLRDAGCWHTLAHPTSRTSSLCGVIDVTSFPDVTATQQLHCGKQ